MIKIARSPPEICGASNVREEKLDFIINDSKKIGTDKVRLTLFVNRLNLCDISRF